MIIIKHFTLFFLFILPYFLSAQNINGKILNPEGKSIEGVHVSIKGNNKGSLSNVNGNFNIYVAGQRGTLVFSHINFDKYELKIQPDKSSYTIILIPKSYNIKQVNIYSKAVICLIPDTPLFVTDYELYQDQIVLTAYKSRKNSKPRLIFMDMNGKIKASAHINKPNALYKDPLDNIYYSSGSSAYQIFQSDDTVYFSEEFDAKIMMDAKNHWAESIGDSVILSYHYYRDQAISYFLKIMPNDSTHEWFSFVNEDALERMSWGGFFDNNEFDRRFEQMIVYKPVQVPLYIFKDSILAFNFIKKNIEIYTIDGELKHSIEMNYASKNKIKDEIFYDEITRKFYGREIRSGRNTLIEIDINSGKAAELYTFKGYPHIEKLQIYNNELFFIYKDYSGDEYKRLYKSPLIKTKNFVLEN